MKIGGFLHLIRWKNLALLLYIQLVLKLIFFNRFLTETNLTTLQFSILVSAIILVTAAGYIINDVFDIKTDLVNKPKKVIVSKIFSIEDAKRYYLITNSLGITLGIGLSLNIQKPPYALFFIGAPLLLYYYSKKLKGIPLIGNISVSILIAISILIIALFDVPLQNNFFIFKTIYLLIGFAFFLNLVREIIKDIEDIKGDYNSNIKTLPILIGIERTKKIASLLCLFPLTLLLILVFNFASIYKITMLYLSLFSILPLLYFMIKLPKATTKKKLNNLSTLLKTCMFLGISSLILFSLNN